MAKISACLIVRDAADTLGACLASLRPHVDELCILDTGSTDDSPAIAQKLADKWELYTGCNVHPSTGQQEDRIWNFADARNKSFAMASHETVFWADADDVVVGAEHLRSLADQLAGQSVALIPYEYSYADAEMTLPNCIHWRERLIRPARDFNWSTPCHEVCQPRAGGAATLPAGHVRILHRAQASKNPREPGRNMRILEEYLQRTGESDVRAMYYMGVEYARHQRFGRARETLRRYTEISGWSDEKCLGEIELGRIHLQEGDCKAALQWATQALTTKSWPDPYWLLVKIFCRMADEGKSADREYNMRRALAWAERGRPLPDAETVLFYNPTERYETERFVARILGMFGRVDEAAEACRRGLKGLPGDPGMLEQLRAYEAVRLGREIDQALGKLVHLGTISERVSEAVKGLVSGQLQLPEGPAANDTGPSPFARIGTGEAVDVAALPAVPEGKLDIVIFTGPAFEEWNPKTIDETGIGGSETMAWEMARGLARLGHRVRHYGWCRPDQEGVYDGVHWCDSARYRDIACDALIVSRYADGVQCVGGTKARARLLWIHDVFAGNMTPEHAGRYDAVLCLSEWHKGNVLAAHPFIDPERIVVTRNGIDLSLFDMNAPHDGATHDTLITIPRNPLRAVYSSSPDRGLQTALELWPLIRAEVPEAELHVFYGFDGLRKAQPALADALEAQAKVTPGVVLHGRVPPRDLAREFLRSGVWFYPTWFSETSCITAMQAKAAGLYCITSPIAALNETVFGGVFVDGAPGPIDMQTRGFELHPPSAEYRSACVAAVVEHLQGKPWTVPSPLWTARECERRFSLVTLAADWSAMLTDLVARVDFERVSRFYVAPEFDVAAREVDETEAA